MRRIPTRVHGVLDYTTAGALLALPRLAGWDAPLTRALTAAAAATTTYSLLTRYELGVIPILSFRAHLALDLLNGLSFCVAPRMFRGEDLSVRRTLIGIGLFELAAVLLSEREPRADA